MKKKLKPVMIIVAVIVILCLLLRVKPIRDVASKVTGIAPGTIDNFGLSVIAFAVGVGAGVFAIALAASLPVVAVVVFVVALVLIGWAVWNYLRPPGQKPENVTLSEKS